MLSAVGCIQCSFRHNLIYNGLFQIFFLEITHRFQTAKSAVRQILLRNLLPWLHNMELVDPSLPQSSPLSNFLIRLQDNQSDSFKPPLKGEGWGSPEGTKMVLNNMFYITVKVSLFLRTTFFKKFSMHFAWVYFNELSILFFIKLKISVDRLLFRFI